MSDVRESPELIQRREVLRRVAWMIGGAVSAPAALAILQGCSAKETPDAAARAPKFLDKSQMALVTALADITIPKTTTSGALDVGVPAFIDSMLADVYDADARQRFTTGAAAFEAAALAANGRPFLEQDAAQRTAFLAGALEQALGAEGPRPFVLMTRELTLLGFYSSKVGIEENMEYVAVPTAYHGCVPVSQLKKPVQWE